MNNELVRMVILGLCTNITSWEETSECILSDEPTGDCCNDTTPYEKKSLQVLRGKHLTLTTLQKMPLSGYYVDSTTGLLRGKGVAFDLFHEIQERAGFTYNITPPPNDDIGDESSGVIKQLKDHEVDMAVVFVPTLKAFRELVSFSTAIAEFEWVLLMARPTASATGSGILAPFQMEVWILIFISLICVGPILYLVILLRVKLCKDDNDVNRLFPLPSCVWFVYGALMKQGSILNPISDSARILFATWWIFITILTSFYTANLTAFLTLSQFTLTIEKPDHMYSYRTHWIADKGGSTETIITNENTFKNLRSMIPAYGNYITGNWEDKLRRAGKGEIYVSEKRKATSIMMLDYLAKIERNISTEKERCQFVVTPKSFLTQPVAFAYPKDSELIGIFNPMLMYLVHGGIVTHLLDSDQPLTTICPLNLANSERKLKNADLSTTYAVVGVGFAFAIIAFVSEVSYRFYKNGLKLNEVSFSNNTGIIQEAWKDQDDYKKNYKDSNFVISQYYSEMITPHRNDDRGPIFGRGNQGNNFIPNKAATSMLFHYTH